MSALHKSTSRNYLARVNDREYPKEKAARIAKKWDFDYWDGDRRICYGGYKYIEGRWASLAQKLVSHYCLTERSKILDIGCGKGYLLYDISKIINPKEIYGLDISEYAITNGKKEIKNRLFQGNCTQLPWPDNYFDFVISINTLHNLCIYDLKKAISEIQRVTKKNSYICVESYRDEIEKTNLLYWQVTCESFYNTKEWEWIFNEYEYTGDYSFIFFE
ncbi:class I SAM-dependent methyltransferase [Synechococcus sp. KORDI-100]|uniref:class I SAM-dependent methyltransferase n=1 Tax=Synechococcus sp. KORDI-100 TaxID=1280380 RepID=UPI001EF68BC5|nr:class I SAM-dependent methyltransferase [Synechococcus sp. KORDI-100]